MIPFAFKFAGGAVGALSGRLSELQKPFSRMAGRARQKRFMSNVGKAGAGNLIKRRGRAGAQASDYKRFGRSRAAMSRGLHKGTHGANAVTAGIANLPNDRGGLRPKNIKARMERQRFAHAMKINKEDEDWARAKPENDTMGSILHAKSGSRADLSQGLRTYVRRNGNKTRADADAAERRYFNEDGSLTHLGDQSVSRAQEQYQRFGGDFESLQVAALVGGSESAPMWKNQYGEQADGSWGRIEKAAEAQNKHAARLSGGGQIANRNQLATALNEANGTARRPDLSGSLSKKAASMDAWADYGEGRMSEEEARQYQAEAEGSILDYKAIAELVNSHPEGGEIAADQISDQLDEARENGDRTEELALLATIEGAKDVYGTGNMKTKRAFSTLLAGTNADGVSNQDQTEALERHMPLEESVIQNVPLKDEKGNPTGVTEQRTVKRPLPEAEVERRQAHNEDSKTYARMKKVYGRGGDAEQAGLAERAARPPDAA
jgi:hypothetical protein